jgi:hypothetical protein
MTALGVPLRVAIVPDDNFPAPTPEQVGAEVCDALYAWTRSPEMRARNCWQITTVSHIPTDLIMSAEQAAMYAERGRKLTDLRKMHTKELGQCRECRMAWPCNTIRVIES